MGLDYTGTVAITILGDQCQPWIDQHPYKHTIGTHDHEFPEKNVTLANNYCRSVNNAKHGPWCYTMNTEHRNGFCLIPMCSEAAAGVHPECKHDRQGTQYMGKISHTVDGHVCLPWTLFNYTPDDFPDDSVYEALNHCRNPDSDIYGPWCYYYGNDGKDISSYCDVPYCSNMTINNTDCKTTVSGIEYAGTRSETIFGDSCQSWSDQLPHAHATGTHNHVQGAT